MKSTAQIKELILSKKSSKGFTLIELLVVIGILAVLLAITLIAINPAKQFQQANDTQRASDVNAILNAVWQYGVDNNGQLTGLDIVEGGSGSAELINPTNTAGLCAALVPDYIAQIPVDPTTGDWTDCSDYDSGYQIYMAAPVDGGRVTVVAPAAEGGNPISVTR
jgi:prepilin-type N-terminal cleavage/methylation domain-containing protein